MIWQCNDKYKAVKKCTTPHVTEDEVRQKFVEVINLLSGFSEELIANCRLAQFTLGDCANIDAKLDESRGELEVVVELARKAIYENSHSTLKNDDWKQRDAEQQKRHRKAANRMAELKNIKSGKQHKSMVLESFIRNLEETENTIDAFDEKLWMMIVERVVVSPDGELTFWFKDGTEISR